jgi:hypothetical protein
MATSIEAYRCDVCGLERIGTEAEMLEHEKIPISPPLPVVFVYRRSCDEELKNFRYFIVVGGEDGKLSEALHSYIQSTESIFVEGEKMFFQNSWEGSDSATVRRFSNWHVPDDELNYFKQLYDASENQKLRDDVGLASSDLTNKL